jgi:AraC family transcriptional regulator of adaptative response/methylated-DNA-[protein]-cysteine methyltransferase
MDDSYHHRTIARAIALIDRLGPQARLADLAGALEMSETHFQRVFTLWAGVSPKRVQQYLTLDLARRMLAQRATVLDVAHAAGLSGTGRLHDLFLRWEAMTPGAYARGGAGLVIRHQTVKTPFGTAVVMATDRGICGLGFAGEGGAAAVFQDLRARWPQADYRADDGRLAELAAALWTGGGAEVPLALIGAPFQIKVWEALLAIPDGQVASYGAIAKAIGAPRAVRAVGTAVGRNPVAWLIPCHRALRATGALGGYHWGLATKRAMLAREAARADGSGPVAQA